MLKKFLKQLSAEALINFDNVLKIQDSFFLKPKDDERARKFFIKFSKQVKQSNLKFVGISLGNNERKIFAPSAYLLELLRDAKVPFIKISKKGEWLFVCGRDIQGTAIYKSAAEKNQVAIVLNLKNEPLGYGKLVKEPSGISICFKKIYDIGDYLRRERK